MLSSSASSIQLHKIFNVFLARPRGRFESKQGRAIVVTNASNTLGRDRELMLGALNFTNICYFYSSSFFQLWMLTILICSGQPIYIRDSALTWTERAIERELDASGVQSAARSTATLASVKN
ncbi:hypothetical protein VNO77_44003 [Canavalia gladiata]|uniref:Uncharacterized protein n=1 Tax=Canavalia gladiata TaxID=3824 RepID=A0AAN9JW15_CANGL